MERIQDFILNTEPEEKTEASAVRKKSDVKYEIAAKTNTDIVIRRKTSRTEKIMAIIPSKEQYYISENGTSKNLDADSMNRFLDRLDEPLEIDLDWIRNIERGKKNCEDILFFLRRYSKHICAGLVDMSMARSYEEPDLVDIFDVAPRLALFLRDVTKTIPERPPITQRYTSFQPCACGVFDGTDNLKYLVFMNAVFGLDKTRDFVRTMIDADINFGCQSDTFVRLMANFFGMDANSMRMGRNISHSAIIQLERPKKGNSDVKLDPDTFSSYCTSYQEEGYSDLRSFFGELNDDWAMQKRVYGEIRDRYPKNLATHHRKMVLKYHLIANDIDDQKISQYYETHKSNEWKSDQYFIKAPKNVGDIVDEAQQQSNCLRSYIGSVAEGRTEIYFLRKKSDPDTSLVTVQVSNGSVVQAKSRFNKEPRYSEKMALMDWAKAKNIAYTA